MRVERCDRGWVRYPGGHTSDGSSLAIHLAARDDTSPAHSTMTYGPDRGYDRRCGWCWLGANHSDDAHAAKIEAD